LKKERVMSKQQTRNSNDFKNLGTIQNRAKSDLSLINEDKRMIPFIMVSDDNAGLRYDWWEDEIYEERLDVNGATFDNLNTFFKDHRMSIDNAIGRIENTRVENGQIKTDVIFGTDTESDTVFRKFKEGILTDVSIGYSIQKVTITERENQPTEVLINEFDIHELSVVWKGFDSKAKIGREIEKIEKEETPNENKTLAKEKRTRALQLLLIA
jgi:hypothetical protein